MARIFLPRRVPGSARGGRGVRLPTAGDVRAAPLPRDPGVAVPTGDPIGQSLVGVAQDVERFGKEVARQEKRFDANKTTEANLAFNRSSMDEFNRRQVEDDPARPGFMEDYKTWLHENSNTSLSGLPEGVSPDARERMRLKQLGSINTMVDAAGRLSLKAAENESADSIGALRNQGVAQVKLNPDLLDLSLAGFDGSLSEFKGTMPSNAFRDASRKGRQDIIEASLVARIRQGRGLEVTADVAAGTYDESLDPASKERVVKAVIAADKERIRVADRLEARADKKRAEAQEQRTGELYDDVIEGRASADALDKELADRNIDGDQFRILRTALNKEETEEVTDNRATIVDLDVESTDGTLTRQRIIKEYAAGNITRATRQAYFNEIQRNAEKGGPLSTEISKRGLASVRASVGGIRGPMSILDPDSSAREDAAIREYKRRVLDGENPLDVEADVSDRYRPKPLSLSAFPRPRYLVGAKTKPDIAATREATLQAFFNGEISKKALNAEATLLDSLESIVDRMEAAAVKTPKAPRK